jgi:hypothetical protein
MNEVPGTVRVGALAPAPALSPAEPGQSQRGSLRDEERGGTALFPR